MQTFLTRPSSRRATVTAARNLAFVLCATAMAVVFSERVFWYWAPDLADFAVVTAFYAPAVAVVLWLVAHRSIQDRWSLLLALPVFAFLVEGVITPIIYTGGPFVPFFPAWFTLWHGVVSIGLMIFGFRRWMLAEDHRTTGLAATALGLFWGTWSITLLLPENVEDPEMVADLGGPLEVLDPAAFAAYAFTYSVVFAAAHWVIGFVWPSHFAPARVTRWAIGVVVAAMLVVWTVVLPWALPMFAVHVWIQWRALNRHHVVASGPTLLEQLVGRVRLRSLLPLALLPVAAAGSYAAWWAIEPNETTMGVLMYGTIAVQALVGAVLIIKSLRRAGRQTEPTITAPHPQPASAASTAANACSSAVG